MLKKFATCWVLLLWVLNFISASARADDVTPVDQGYKNESEAGLVINSGNAESQSYTLKQASSYGFDFNKVKLSGHYLNTSSNGTLSADNWDITLRYERYIHDGFSLYLGQNIEADVFAGYFQRYNSDLGAKYAIFKSEDFHWNVEAGYRYSLQNSVDETRQGSSFLRAFTEIAKDWTKTFSAKYWVEALPDLTKSNGFRLNTEASVSSVLTSIFSIKSAYGLRFNNSPVAGVTHKTDTVFTTALVAKF